MRNCSIIMGSVRRPSVFAHDSMDRTTTSTYLPLLLVHKWVLSLVKNGNHGCIVNSGSIVNRINCAQAFFGFPNLIWKDILVYVYTIYIYKQDDGKQIFRTP